VSWTENLIGSSDVKFQIRTASDNSGIPGTWTEWLGPVGTGDYYTDETGGETINVLHTDSTNDQWLQYRAILTPDNLNIPAMSNIIIHYNIASEISTVITNTSLVVASKNSKSRRYYYRIRRWSSL